MKIEETKLKGCFHLTPSVYEDSRGYFYESFNHRTIEESVGYPIQFVQDNQSQSSYGVIRGLHLQLGKSAQSKLLRVVSGKILDVAVDIRPDSDTYGEYISVILSGENKHQLFVPKGFVHGFSILSATAIVQYKVDNYYAPNSESGIIYNDSDLNIDWQIPSDDIKTSNKDLLLPTLKKFTKIYA